MKRAPLAALALLLALAACGFPKVRPTPTQVAAPSNAQPTPTLEELTAQHVFGVDMTGFAFTKLPGRLQRQARRQYRAATESLGPGAGKLTLRALTRSGDPFAVVLVVALTAESAAQPGVGTQFADGLAQTASATAEDIDLGGLDGYVIESEGGTVVAWQDQNLLVATFAPDRAAGVTAARAMVQASV
ncbi:MAG TPA: hypothetical protein VFK61_06360 [Candidatus Limnocylindria bacterium]|jgi:hypothetical protein|nr:hypothetical protein [Candidatus Limnocylindria bacterium]